MKLLIVRGTVIFRGEHLNGIELLLTAGGVLLRTLKSSNERLCECTESYFFFNNVLMREDSSHITVVNFVILQF